MAISTHSTSIVQQLMLINLHSRKLLLHNPLYNSSSSSSTHDLEQPRQNNTFDANVVMVLSVLLCALICSLGLNSIIRCALRCSTLVSADTGSPSAQPATNIGIKSKALKTFPVINYAVDLKMDNECAICLSDFAAGERVRVLPKCHHGFHVRCIDTWLTSHSSCPTCRHCLIQTCNKIVGCTAVTVPDNTSARPVPPVQEVCVSIEPLHPEGLVRNHET